MRARATHAVAVGCLLLLRVQSATVRGGPYPEHGFPQFVPFFPSLTVSPIFPDFSIFPGFLQQWEAVPIQKPALFCLCRSFWVWRFLRFFWFSRFFATLGSGPYPKKGLFQFVVVFPGLAASPIFRTFRFFRVWRSLQFVWWVVTVWCGRRPQGQRSPETRISIAQPAVGGSIGRQRAGKKASLHILHVVKSSRMTSWENGVAFSIGFFASRTGEQLLDRALGHTISRPGFFGVRLCFS